MISQYLLKYITATGRYTNHDPATDVFPMKGVVLGGVLFDETNIVTVSGVNSMTTAIGVAQDFLQGELDDLTDALTAQGDASSDALDAAVADLEATDDALLNTIQAVSGASSIRDDQQDTSVGILVSGLNVSIADNLTKLHQVSGFLQSEINTIVNDRAKEERFEAVSGQTTFTLSTITFDADANVHDLQVFKNGLKMFQSETGVLSGVSGGDFVKVGTTQVQWLYPLRDGDRVIVREERTGAGAGSISNPVDFENVTSDIIPDVNGVRNLGSGLHAFNSIFLKDTITGDVWQIQCVSGTLTGVAFGS